MSDLEAAAIGPEVPEGRFPVTVHSVFQRAVNLDPGGAGRLLTLLSPPAPDPPQGIRLAAAVDFTALGLRPGGAGRFSPEGIRLDRSPDALRIHFAGATRTPAAPLPFLPRVPGWAAAARELAGLQQRAATHLRLAGLLGPEPGADPLGLNAAAARLGHAVRTGAPDAARAALAGLVGLGPGLTPSGDDFLCGFLLAGRCRLDRAPLLRALEAEALERLPSTGPVSATFLRCAAEGQASGELRALAQALRDGAGCREPLAALCAFGHSSGMDLATGFLYGLNIWTATAARL
jgi:hypothetical protein